MPLPLFLGLIVSVIAFAGLSIALAYALGLPLFWLALAAPLLALIARGVSWR